MKLYTHKTIKPNATSNYCSLKVVTAVGSMSSCIWEEWFLVHVTGCNVPGMHQKLANCFNKPTWQFPSWKKKIQHYCIKHCKLLQTLPVNINCSNMCWHSNMIQQPRINFTGQSWHNMSMWKAQMLCQWYVPSKKEWICMCLHFENFQLHRCPVKVPQCYTITVFAFNWKHGNSCV